MARAGRVPLSAGARVTGETRRLAVKKTGDAAAYLSLAGARFQVRPVIDGGAAAPVGELVTAGDGTSSLLELDPGRYQVAETGPPAGYATAGPWIADLTTTDVVLEAPNSAIPGTGRITKVDAATGRPLAGAKLSLAYDADRDGAFETPVAQWASGAEPAVRDLRPGDYEVTEMAAPGGYRLADQPVRFAVTPGNATSVTVGNAPCRPHRNRALNPYRHQRHRPRLCSRRPDRRHRRSGAAREQPLMPLLPQTGQPLSLLAGAGSALVVAGLLLVVAANRPGLQARRRARSLVRPVVSPS